MAQTQAIYSSVFNQMLANYNIVNIYSNRTVKFATLNDKTLKEKVSYFCGLLLHDTQNFKLHIYRFLTTLYNKHAKM